MVGLWVGLALGGVASGQGVGTSSASGKRPMTFEDLQRMKRVSDPQVSASGKWVMFSAVDVDLTANTKTSHLWVVPLAGEEEGRGKREEGRGSGRQGVVGGGGSAGGGERQITFWKDGESGGRFSPDGKKVLFEAGGWGGWWGFAQIFLADWDDAAGEIGTSAAVDG